MILDEFEQLDDDWHLIDTICNEAKKCQQLLEKSMYDKPVSNKIYKSFNLIKKNHRKVMLSFCLKARILGSISPQASKQVEKRLKVLNDSVRVVTHRLKRWETDSGITTIHLRHDFIYLDNSYNEFGLETKMFKDLVKNTARLMT